MSRKLQLLGIVALVTLMMASVANAQGRRFGGGTNLISVAANEAVQKDAGIATDQADKIRELSRDFREARRALREDIGVNFRELQDLPDDERQEVLKEINDANAKLAATFAPKLTALIGKEQLTRVKQILVQATGLSNLSVRKDLGVTEEQQAKLAAVQEEFRGKMTELRQGGGFDRDAFAKLRTDQEAANVNVLTDDQKKKYVALKGKPFDVSLLRGRRRR